jgi:hypothetical protein
MCHQEGVLYGDLVLWLRDRAAELHAGDSASVEAERERLDALIRDWFFTPQGDLHGCAPRDIIWAEQLGQPNPIHPEQVEEFFDDDCPVCQFERDRVQAALDAGEEHGWQWHYDDGGFPLIARYDPEGWDHRWAEDLALFEAMHGEEEAQSSTAAPAYEPPPVNSRQVDPEDFVEVLKQPWIDPALHQAAEKVVEHCDIPVPDPFRGLRYRRATQSEALSLVAGLDRQGVDVKVLLAQIDAWPYQNVALDWLSDPVQNVALLCQALEQEIAPDDREGQARFRQHRDFVIALAQVVPLGARLWLQGWLEAVALGAFASPDLPF